MLRLINWSLCPMGRMPWIILRLWGFVCIRDAGSRGNKITNFCHRNYKTGYFYEYRLINRSLCHMHVMDYFASLGIFMHQGRRIQIGNKITAHVLINFVCRALATILRDRLLAVLLCFIREEGRIKDWKLHVKLIMDKLAFSYSLGYRHSIGAK